MQHNWFAQSGGGLLASMWLVYPIKVALMKPTFVPDRDNQLTWSDIKAQEIVPSAPYVLGGALLANKSKFYDAPADRVMMIADDTVWGPGFTADAAFAVVYDSGSAQPLWSLVDFEGTKSVVNGTLTIDWASIGIVFAQAI